MLPFHSVLSVGSVSVDIKAFSTETDENEAYRDGSIDLVPGGVARGMAINLHRLGLKTAIQSVVGNDIFGDFLRRGLEQEGVNTQLLKNSSQYKTSLFSVMVTPNTHPSCIYCNDALKEITLDESVLGFIRQEEITTICLDSNIPEKTLEAFYRLKETMNSRNKPLFIFQNATAPDIATKSMPYIQHIDLFGCNEFEAAAILRHAGIEPEKLIPSSGQELIPSIEIAEAFSSLGYKHFIITFGNRGVLVFHQGNTYIEKPYVPDSIVDTIGAGDAYASGYLLGWLTGKPIKVCIHYGLACAKETLMTRQTVSDLLNPQLLEKVQTSLSLKADGRKN